MDGFVQLTLEKLTTSQGVLELNRMLKDLYDNTFKHRYTRVRISGNQSLAVAGTVYDVQFDTVVNDVHSDFDVSTYKWTCPKDGYYLNIISLLYDVGADGDRLRTTLTDASNNNKRYRQHTAGAGGANSSIVVFVEKLTAGDVRKVRAANMDNIDTLVANTAYTYWEIYKLGDVI